MYEVHDVMSADVRTISADVTVGEATRQLVDSQFSGMPVVDGEGRLVGIISEYQMLETLYSSHFRAKTVRDVMTKDVITVTPDTILSDATSLMMSHRIRRLPVVVDGKIVGIVARRDLLRYTIEAGDELWNFLDEIKAFACPSSSS